MSNPEKQKKRKSFIPGFIRHDFLRKLIALLFAILVWQRVDTQISEPDTLRDIPVNVSLPDNLERENETPIKVNLKVRASRRVLNNLSPYDDVHINVKLKEPAVQKKPLIISYRIDPAKDISLPSGITVLQVTPELISVNVDRKISKSVPVELTYSGVLPDGYSYRVVQLIPDSIVITGPQNLIKPMKKIKTEPVIFRKINVEDFECKVKIVPEDNVSVSRDKITAMIEIYKKNDVREFNQIPIKPFGSPASSARITLLPDKAFVIVGGAKKSVELMNGNQLHPFVDITGLKVPGIYNLKVQCWIDDKDVHIKKIQPVTIDVKLGKP